VIDLRLGRWQDVLDFEHVDAIVTDPPYGERTHAAVVERRDRSEGSALSQIEYGCWTHQDVHEFVASWSPRCNGWIAALTSHDLIASWESAFDAAGRYSFAPVPCVIRGMTCRMAGDGPSSWTVYLMVGRPRSVEFARWGTMPGAYVGPQTREARGGRGKPPWLCEALIRDYTRPGNVVADPCAGWGGFLRAADKLCRHAIGAEVDADAYREANHAIASPMQHALL
jgi:DNA modification methylase